MMLSTIICTRNRSASLGRALQSYRRVRRPAGLDWELIVVDNGSTDDTWDLVRTQTGLGGLPLRYVLEEKPGLSRARNRGADEAAGQIISYTDDDALADEGLLVHLAEAFARYDAAVVGGKILPLWETSPPAWLTPNLYGYLALLDYGERAFFLDRPRVWGANFAVRAEALRRCGGFDPRLGRMPGKLYGEEEVDLCRRLLNRGEQILYYPRAVVHHCLSGSRLRKPYFHQWRHDQGELRARHRPQGRWEALVIPYYLFRLLAGAVPRYLCSLLGSREDRFERALEISYLRGFIAGRICRYLPSGPRRRRSRLPRTAGTPR